MILILRGSRERDAPKVLSIVIQLSLVYPNRPLIKAQELDASAVSGAEPDRNGVRLRPPDPSRGSSTERGRALRSIPSNSPSGHARHGSRGARSFQAYSRVLTHEM